MIRFDRFSEGKTRAVVLSFDDGKIQDRRLVELLNTYHLKATFHINSGRLGQSEFVSTKEINDLYAMHEVALHGQNHARLKNCFQTAIVTEILNDRKLLEHITNSIISGFAYPYGDCGGNIVQTISSCGIQYARTTANSHNFDVPENFMIWNPTNHILNAYDDVKRFLSRMDTLGRDSLLFLWGHSFEMDENDGWVKIKQLFELLANNNDIWYASCGDYFSYITAIRNLKLSADETIISNPSAIPVWVSFDKAPLKINCGEMIKL